MGLTRTRARGHNRSMPLPLLALLFLALGLLMPAAAAIPPDDPALLASIRRHEGLRLLPYRDARGHWSIGYGHCYTCQGGRVAVEVPLSREVAERLLREDVARAHAAAAAYPWFARLPDAAQRVVVELVFQLGATGWAGFERTHALLAEGRLREAARELLKSEWATQVPARAERMAAALAASAEPP